jgi:hypothetical protein
MRIGPAATELCTETVIPTAADTRELLHDEDVAHGVHLDPAVLARDQEREEAVLAELLPQGIGNLRLLVDLRGYGTDLAVREVAGGVAQHPLLVS